MNAHDRIPLADPSSSQALIRPLWAGFVGPDPRKFERRLGVVLWVGLIAVVFSIG